VICIRDRF